MIIDPSRVASRFTAPEPTASTRSITFRLHRARSRHAPEPDDHGGLMSTHAHARRPIRFGTGPGRVSDRAALLAAGRSIERLGYATFAMADHFMLPFAPLLALQAVADATSTVRLTQTVLNQDFRHPAVLAKELATLDVLCGGRL